MSTLEKINTAFAVFTFALFLIGLPLLYVVAIGLGVR